MPELFRRLLLNTFTDLADSVFLADQLIHPVQVDLNLFSWLTIHATLMKNTNTALQGFQTNRILREKQHLRRNE